MKLTVLGASGGIARGLRTISFLVDDDILIDAGTGVNDLTLEQMAAIRHVFLTHAHLDHIACLPMLADAALDRRVRPLTVHALPETLTALKDSIFNDRVWPDYTVKPTPEAPWVALEPVVVGQAVDLHGRAVTPLPARHSVPAVGYAVEEKGGGFAYSGDTTLCEPFWAAVNGMPKLRYVFLECTFRDDVSPELALEWGHMTPRLWAEALALYQGVAEVRVVHMEPGKEDRTLDQLAHAAGISLVQAESGGVFNL
ncbi:MAG: 3',5'-cyclic-nucleotide phosphodiesterase [Sulfuricellaceae bacterium]|jgi:ribonuclease BN (tRNA processing enzyme)